MTPWRRIAPLVGAVVLLGLATVFVLLAVDVRAWQGTLRRDDVRFDSRHSPPDLWRSPAILPGDPAEHLLGLDSSLAYRRSLQRFWFGQVGVGHASTESLAELRVTTENDLQELVQHARTSVERSRAANLLGVMTITTPSADNGTQVQTLLRAASYFRQAIVADPGDYPAKLNLEMLLRLERPAKTRFGADARGGFGPGGSHGAGVIGGGY